jgi:hypothetical protein
VPNGNATPARRAIRAIRATPATTMNEITRTTTAADGPAAVSAAASAAAARTSASLRDRIVAPGYWLVVGLTIGLAAAGQFTEDWFDSPPLQLLNPETSVARWAIIAVVAYEVLILRIIEPRVQRAVAALRPVVRIEPEAYDAYENRMGHAQVRVELGLLAIAVVIVALLFPIGGNDLPTTRDPVTGALEHLPAGLPGLIVLAGYVALGWAGLSLVYNVVRLGRTLGHMTREPLDINPFDTSNLLPFGRIALLVSLAPAGVLAILLAGLGQPNSFLSWSVVMLVTGASVLALLLPLRGVHHQMYIAKARVLRQLNLELTDVYRRLQTAQEVSPEDVAKLGNRTGTLIPLRNVVNGMTTWPFQDTVALGRAVLIASAPLVYTALNELINIFFIIPLNKP